MKSKGSIISKIQYILGFIGVMALGILSLVSFIDKNDNVSYINSVVTKSINYTQKSYVSKDIEYKSEITIKLALL